MTSTNLKATRIEIRGYKLDLLPERGVFWPDKNTLFVADTHFGKDTTFRRAGIPVPPGSLSGTLSLLGKMLAETAATRLVLLGDMFHSRTSLSEAVRESLEDFFDTHASVQFEVVLGNHDRHIKNLPRRWPTKVLEEGAFIDGIQIAHHPTTEDLICPLRMCGHIHPSFRLITKKESEGRLPCFWLSGSQLVLPAIGKFTGTHAVKPAVGDRIWLVTPDQVLEVSCGNVATNKKSRGGR